MTVYKILASRSLFSSQRFHSGYQVFVLVASLGNYQTSRMAAGNHPDAVKNGTQVADLFRQLTDHVVVHTSVQRGRAFNRRQRVSAQTFIGWMDEFVGYVRHHKSGDKPPLLIFYYFGHGGSHEMGQGLHMIPETFEDNPDVDDMSALLIDRALADELPTTKLVEEKFEAVTTQSLVLFDACRTHDNEEAQLLQIWGELGQNVGNVAGILAVAQALMLHGAACPAITSSSDGKPAKTVEQNGVKLGPIAHRLTSFFGSVGASDGFGLQDFVRAMLGPANGVRVFTSLQESAVAGISRRLFLAGDRYKTAASRQRGGPAQAAASRYTPPSANVGVRRLVNPKAPVSDFVQDPKHSKVVYFIDANNSLYKWNRGHSVKKKRSDLGFPSICATTTTIYIFTHTEPGYVLTLKKGKPSQEGRIKVPYRPTRLVPSQDETAVWAALSEDNGERVYKLDTAGCHNVGFPLVADITSYVEWGEDGICFIDASKMGQIFRFKGGGIEQVVGNLVNIRSLGASSQYLFALSKPGDVLYRISRQRVVQQLNLQEYEMGTVEKRHFDHLGFRVDNDHQITVLCGDFLMQLDLSHANWQPADETPKPRLDFRYFGERG